MTAYAWMSIITTVLLGWLAGFTMGRAMEGGAIDWATYYFRDRDLAAALIAASDRGVAVTLHVEGQPRRNGANAAVLASELLRDLVADV